MLLFIFTISNILFGNYILYTTKVNRTKTKLRLAVGSAIITFFLGIYISIQFIQVAFPSYNVFEVVAITWAISFVLYVLTYWYYIAEQCIGLHSMLEERKNKVNS